MTSPAARALERALADPRAAERLAREAAAAARHRRDAAELSVALQALGLALRYQERPRESAAALRAAVRAGERAGWVAQAGRARRSLAVSLSLVGAHRAALAALDTAAGELTGVELAELVVQRAIVLRHLGRQADAARAATQAVAALRAGGDGAWLARGLSILGLARVELGEFAAAEQVLTAAEEMFRRLGQRADAAGNRHNRGWCAAVRGEIPAALRIWEEAEREFADLGLPLVELRLDRVRLLLAAGLAVEAGELAREVAAELAGRRAETSYADALLAVGDAALAAGDPGAAVEAARRARALYRRQGRLGWAALARHAELRARWAAGENGPRLRAEASRTAAALAGAGRRGPAREALLVAGQAALAAGDRRGAARALAAAAAGRRRGPADARARAWLAEALLRREGGDRRGALAALRAGLRVLEADRAALGALELRARATAHAEELVALGRTLAAESGRPEQVLRWSEYGRAAVFRLPPVRPPADPELGRALAELRVIAGRPHGADRRRREAELRETVRRRAHRLEGSRDPVARLAPDPEEVGALLDGRALVSLTAVDGRLLAVVQTGRTLRLAAVGAADAATRDAVFLLAALRRALTAAGPDDATAALTRLLRAAARLDRQLLEPLRPAMGDRDLVLVPPAGLAMLPWHALPTAAGRTLAVAPSAGAWAAAARRPAPAGATVLVAGPGLTHADAEVAALAALYPGPTVLTGRRATVDRTLAALDGAAVAHLAAHGEVVRDNPLFSALRLADGPLMGYDLDRLARPPAVVVLAACDSAAGTVYGEELLGLATVLLHGGTGSVVGAVAPVPDSDALGVTSLLHRHVAAGRPAAEALARTVDALGRDAPPSLRATALALVPIGA